MIGDAVDFLTDPASWTGSDGMLVQLTQQLLLTVTALAVIMVVALPAAMVLGHLGKGGFLAINISNIGRAIPTFAVLILLSVGPVGTDVLGPYGRAGLATLVALTLFGLPPIVTNTYVGVREVDPEAVQAAWGMGMTGRQLFFRVELPLALPLIVTGLRLSLVQMWATATIAALVAGPGLGNVITSGFYRSDYGQGLAGALVVAGVALVLEGIAAVIEHSANPRARAERKTRGDTAAPEPRNALA